MSTTGLAVLSTDSVVVSPEWLDMATMRHTSKTDAVAI